MRKITGLSVLFLMLLFCLRGNAKIYFKDTLIINGGDDSIELSCGEKTRLEVRDAFWEYPLIDGLRFLSTDKTVAWVDERGVIHAMLPGEAEILVMDEAGRNSNITVVVTGETKLSKGQIVGFLVLILASFAVLLKIKISLF